MQLREAAAGFLRHEKTILHNEWEWLRWHLKKKTLQSALSGKIYDDGFYQSIQNGSRACARRVLPEVLALLPEPLKENLSVLDFGCATGEWLAVWRELGAKRILGADGFTPPAQSMSIPPECFARCDITQGENLKLPDGQKFSIAQCMEVAEHIDAQYADALVQTLCGAADVILFSAAIPNQTGTHHVNCQRPEYWIEKFAARGFLEIDCVRERIWNYDIDEMVGWCYQQNTFLYAKDTPENAALLQLRARNRPGMYYLVHPNAVPSISH